MVKTFLCRLKDDAFLRPVASSVTDKPVAVRWAFMGNSPPPPPPPPDPSCPFDLATKQRRASEVKSYGSFFLPSLCAGLGHQSRGGVCALSIKGSSPLQVLLRFSGWHILSAYILYNKTTLLLQLLLAKHHVLVCKSGLRLFPASGWQQAPSSPPVGGGTMTVVSCKCGSVLAHEFVAASRVSSFAMDVDGVNPTWIQCANLSFNFLWSSNQLWLQQLLWDWWTSCVVCGVLAWTPHQSSDSLFYRVISLRSGHSSNRV